MQFDPSRSADPPTISGICCAISSNVIPKAFLVAISSLPKSIFGILVNLFCISKSAISQSLGIFLSKFL